MYDGATDIVACLATIHNTNKNDLLIVENENELRQITNQNSALLYKTWLSQQMITYLFSSGLVAPYSVTDLR